MNQVLNKRRQELEDEIDGELGLEKDLFEDYHPLLMQQEKLTESQQRQQEVKTSKKSTMESDKHETHHSNNSGHVQSAKIKPPKRRNYTVLAILLIQISPPKTVKHMGN